VTGAPSRTVSARAVFGAIRWDAWNGLAGDVISSTVAQTMAPVRYHRRLPWYATVDPANETKISFNADRQSIMDQELQLAHAAGLSFWAYDTYCVWPTDAHIPECQFWWDTESVGYKATDPAYGLRLHRNSSVKHLMNFSLVLLGSSPATPQLRPRYLELFADPSFQRVGDRPLVFLFNVGRQQADHMGGWAKWREQWDAFRRESVAQGSGNPYFVAMCVGAANLHVAEEARAGLGFDAVSAYALPGGTVGGTAFAAQAAEAREFWGQARAAGLEQVVPVPTGWDPRPRADHEPVWVKEGPEHFLEPTAAELARLVEDAAAAAAEEEPGVALLYAWNENSEGGWLLPTLGNGTTRLDAVAAGLKRRAGAERNHSLWQ